MPYLYVLLAFMQFLKWNGGSITLGDKSNHTLAFHLPQLLYFALFTACMLIPMINLCRIKLPLARMLMQVPLAVLVIHHLSINHPFLLSDNRHYTFYAWKLVRLRMWIKYGLSVPYIASVWLINTIVHESRLWLVMFWVSTALTLVPSPLLEVRYFLIPYLLLRLQLKPSRRSVVAELIFHLVVNAVTFYMYLYRPFRWPQEHTALQRFMW